ncbi:hypothetical protein FISHEDRAFT_57217 [Fistulina hepatica ATCC 64428]|nr:hypothetical protein FISHEDRAFT_57217 [Fistulina hepatica ATCC 64428]
MSTGIRFAAASVLQRIQQGLLSPPVELAYLPHERWPFPSQVSAAQRLHISTLDSSFNPPTRAHLALLALPRPVHPAGELLNTTTTDYSAKLLLLSVRNADKSLKPGDATYVQRLSMMEQTATDSQLGDNANIAIAVIDEPTFVGKSTLLLEFLRQRLRAMLPPTHDLPAIELTFLVGYDTLERIFAPRYYLGDDSTASMLVALRRFFSEEGSRIVCANRAPSSYPSSGDNSAHLMREFVDAGYIHMLNIGEVEQTYSSSAVRRMVVQGNNDWKCYVTDAIASNVMKEGLYGYH